MGLQKDPSGRMVYVPPGEKPPWEKNKGANDKFITQSGSSNNTPASPTKEIERPEFNSLINPDTGKLENQYKVWAGDLGDPTKVQDRLSTNTLNTDFLTQMREDGLRKPGESSVWRDLTQQKIERQAGDVQGNLAKSQLSQLDTAAMRGGVGAGAAERMAGQGVRDSLAAQQQAYGLGLDADIADEERRAQGLRDLSGAEMGVAGIDMQNQQFNIGTQTSNDKFDILNQIDTNKYNINNDFESKKINIGNTIKDVTHKNIFDMGLYTELMGTEAFKNLAGATPSSGGGKK